MCKRDVCTQIVARATPPDSPMHGKRKLLDSGGCTPRPPTDTTMLAAATTAETTLPDTAAAYLSGATAAAAAVAVAAVPVPISSIGAAHPPLAAYETRAGSASLTGTPRLGSSPTVSSSPLGEVLLLHKTYVRRPPATSHAAASSQPSLLSGRSLTPRQQQQAVGSDAANKDQNATAAVVAAAAAAAAAALSQCSGGGYGSGRDADGDAQQAPPKQRRHSAASVSSATSSPLRHPSSGQLPPPAAALPPTAPLHGSGLLSAAFGASGSQGPSLLDSHDLKQFLQLTQSMSFLRANTSCVGINGSLRPGPSSAEPPHPSIPLPQAGNSSSRLGHNSGSANNGVGEGGGVQVADATTTSAAPLGTLSAPVGLTMPAFGEAMAVAAGAGIAMPPRWHPMSGVQQLRPQQPQLRTPRHEDTQGDVHMGDVAQPLCQAACGIQAVADGGSAPGSGVGGHTADRSSANSSITTTGVNAAASPSRVPNAAPTASTRNMMSGGVPLPAVLPRAHPLPHPHPHPPAPHSCYYASHAESDLRHQALHNAAASRASASSGDEAM